MNRRGTAVRAGLAGAMLLGLTLSCGGLTGGGSRGARGASEPLQVGVQGQDDRPAPKTLEFGKPASWTRSKEQYDADGHAVVHYTLQGEAASVQLVLHPPGAEPPDPVAASEACVAAVLAEAGDAVSFDAPSPVSRSLSGQQVEGFVQGMSVKTPDGIVHGEHGAWVVRGPKTSCMVVVDVPDASHPTAAAEVEEVLKHLRVP